MVFWRLYSGNWGVASHDNPARDWPLWSATLVSMLLVWKTRIHLLWLIGSGAVIGAIGLI